MQKGLQVASLSSANVEAEIKHDEVMINFGNRRYRIRGLCKNLSVDALRVNVLASNDVHQC